MKKGREIFVQFALGLATVIFLASCAPDGGKNTDPAESTSGGATTGSLTMTVVWADGSQDLPLRAPFSLRDSPFNQLAAANVVTMRGIVSAADITPSITQDFSATPGQAGSGTITGIPAGGGRALTVQGLNSSGLVIYQGGTTNLTITGGQTTEAGEVIVSLASGFHTVGGTVTGRTGTLVLDNNQGNEQLTITANGTFTIATLSNGSNYAVTVATQPTGQACTVTGGTGTIVSANVTSVAVVCTDTLDLTITLDSATLSGSILTVNYTVTNNGASLIASGFVVHTWGNRSTAPAPGTSGADTTSPSLTLAAGASENRMASMALVTATGTAYVVADWGSTVTETDETNNVASNAWTAVFASEGTSSSPISLTAPVASRASEVAGGGNSYYVVDGMTLGTWTVTISSMLRDADLRVYSDTAFSVIICSSSNSGTSTDTCNFSCGSSTCSPAYVRIFGADSNGTTFLFSMQQ